jgi:hypothetical protein
MLGMVIGSSIGSMIPMLWGASIFSYWSVIFTFIGGILGIWAGFKLNQ